VIDEGEDAPEFDLPAVVDGDIKRVGLDEYLGTVVVVLAFYPADFNPACGETAGLDELDIFTMQKDVAVLGISGDSVYSHRAFAEEYGLGLPLLADVDGTVAETYGVAADAATHQTRRAVVVIDLDGTVAYAWVAAETGELPDIGSLRGAFDAVTNESIADEQYRAGYDRYTDGQANLAKAGTAYEDGKWMIAYSEFETAREAFEAASGRFDTAARFSADELATRCASRAEQATDYLARTAASLQDSSRLCAAGDSMDGEAKRGDAELALAAANDLGEPLAPDAVPPDEVPDDWGEEPPQRLAEVNTTGSLDIDFDALDASAAIDIDTDSDDRTDVPDTLDEANDAERDARDDETGDGRAEDDRDAFDWGGRESG
jgi:peroxiredoxin